MPAFLRRVFLVSLALCALIVTAARADIPVVAYSQVFTQSGSLPIINLVGQSSCSMVLSGATVGYNPYELDSALARAVHYDAAPIGEKMLDEMLATTPDGATLTPYGSGDNGNTYNIVQQIGQRTSNGTYGANITPYLTQFYVGVDLVQGTVTVSEACSASNGFSYAAPSPTPTPLPPPTPTPTPVPTPTPTPGPTTTPSPSPSPTPSNFPGGVANDTPLAYYRLDDGTSPATFADTSGNSYTATSHLGTITSAASLVTTNSDPAESFGSGGYGLMPQTMLDYHLAQFSLMWLGKTPASGPGPTYRSSIQYYGIIGKMSTDTSTPNKTNIGWDVGGGSGYSGGRGCNGLEVSANTAYFVVITFDVSQATPVVQGSLNGGAFVNCNATPSIKRGTILGIPSPGTKQYIATSVGQFTSLSPTGTLDDIAIFPYDLTIGQVQTLATLAGY